MNFWKYTFNGRFMFYASIAIVVAIVVMLMFYIAGNNRAAFLTFIALTTLLTIGVTGQLIRWKRYSRYRKNSDEYQKIRLN